VRESNEDSVCVLGPGEIVDDFDALLAVADGMGGHQAGEVASQYATDKLQELLASSAYRDWVSYDPGRNDYNILVIKEVLERLNREIYDLAVRERKHRGMGTTITAALIAQGQVVLGHAGDSRAYLLDNGKLIQLTTDHSWVQEQVEQNKMSPEQAANDPRKNQITRALGVSSVIRIDRQVTDLRPGNVLLLCTDGLTNMLSDDEIAHWLMTIPDPQKVCSALVATANQRGGLDNISVIVARVLNGDVLPRGHWRQEDFDTQRLGKPLPRPVPPPAAPDESAAVADVAMPSPAMSVVAESPQAVTPVPVNTGTKTTNWLILVLKVGGLLALAVAESIIVGLVVAFVQEKEPKVPIVVSVSGLTFLAVVFAVMIVIALNPSLDDQS
jgi:protein phosphatase